VFIERLWRSVKYEEVYLRDYADGWDAEEGLSQLEGDRVPASLNALNLTRPTFSGHSGADRTESPNDRQCRFPTTKP
jgi:hypothetical protein